MEKAGQQNEETQNSTNEKTTSSPVGRTKGKRNSSLSGTSLRLENCAKTFDDGTQALLPFDLTVEASETVVILGPSGCGKTTMLRILAGLETPNPEGKVFFGTEEVTEVPIEKRNVGMVFQSYALFPNMNVAQNIAYGLKVRGDRGKAKETRVNEMLDMMQIRELMHRRINQLSGGQKQRVALARAIAVRPRVLLMDEPLTALDAKLRDSLRVEIDSLLRSLGITAVYVTHDQAEAMALGDRIVVMDIGKVAQIGTPREIYFEPKSRFVAEFIGNINRLKCMLRNGKIEFPGSSVPLKEAPGVRATENQMAEVFFRPEHAKVVEVEQGDFTATVVASFFMGDRTRLIINGSTVENLTIETVGQQSFVKGQAIDIKIDPSALLTLKE